MSAFSDFIRNASPEEKEAVYTDMMKRATERQMSEVESEAFEAWWKEYTSRDGNEVLSEYEKDVARDAWMERARRG